MITKELENKASKFMSFILRHNPQYINIQLDSNGWVDVAEFIEKANKSNQDFIFDLNLIKQVVENNNKQRFKLSEDNTKLKANQGHTVQVDLGLTHLVPPDVLYHGTAKTSLDSIFKSGLKPMKRHDVHLSLDKKTALSVGSRYGEAVILEIDAKKMHEDGLKFMCSENNVWLTSTVPIEYIKLSK